MIIDDERDLCHLMTSFLVQMGHEVQAAYSLTEGLDTVEQMHPDIVILDNNLPDGFGWDNIANIHSVEPSCKILLISAYAYKLKSETAPQNVSIIEKPISLLKLQNYFA